LPAAAGPPALSVPLDLQDYSTHAFTGTMDANLIRKFGTLSDFTITGYDISDRASVAVFHSGAVPTVFTIPAALNAKKVGQIAICADKDYIVTVWNGYIAVAEAG